VLGRQWLIPTPWLTERHGYDPTCGGILQGTYQVKKGTSLGEFVKNTLALDIVGKSEAKRS
ncbi:hypothetical protein, partial [Enterobacter hormaechei]